jgi:hypothetical protein
MGGRRYFPEKQTKQKILVGLEMDKHDTKNIKLLKQSNSAERSFFCTHDLITDTSWSLSSAFWAVCFSGGIKCNPHMEDCI